MLYTSALRVDINLTAAMRILLPSTLKMTDLASFNRVLNRVLADDHTPMSPMLRIHLVLDGL